MRNCTDHSKSILKRRKKVILHRRKSNVIPLPPPSTDIGKESWEMDGDWAKWYQDNFDYKSYVDKNTGTKKPQFVTIYFHMFGPIMFSLPVMERVLLYLIYRWSVNRRSPFMKPDYAELAKHLLCHKSAVYRAINHWLKKGFFKVTRNKDGIKYFALDDDPELWFGSFREEKNIIRNRKKSSQNGKNVFRGGKNDFGETTPEVNKEAALATSAENPKNIIRNIKDDNKIGSKSSFLKGEGEASTLCSPTEPINAADPYSDLSTPDLSERDDDSTTLSVLPSTPNHAERTAPARQVPPYAKDCTGSDGLVIVNSVFRTLKERHLAHFPSYEFTEKDKFGFRKAARLLIKIPDDRVAPYIQKHSDAACIKIAGDYCQFIKDKYDEEDWCEQPHGGNYCSEVRLDEFIELIQRETYGDRKMKQMSRPGRENWDSPEYRKEREEKDKKLRSQFLEWAAAYEKGELPCFGKKDEMIKGATLHYGGEENNGALCQQCRKNDHDQWVKCRLISPNNNRPPYSEC